MVDTVFGCYNHGATLGYLPARSEQSTGIRDTGAAAAASSSSTSSSHINSGIQIVPRIDSTSRKRSFNDVEFEGARIDPSAAHDNSHASLSEYSNNFTNNTGNEAMLVQHQIRNSDNNAAFTRCSSTKYIKSNGSKPVPTENISAHERLERIRKLHASGAVVPLNNTSFSKPGSRPSTAAEVVNNNSRTNSLSEGHRTNEETATSNYHSILALLHPLYSPNTQRNDSQVANSRPSNSSMGLNYEPSYQHPHANLFSSLQPQMMPYARFNFPQYEGSETNYEDHFTNPLPLPSMSLANGDYERALETRDFLQAQTSSIQEYHYREPIVSGKLAEEVKAPLQGKKPPKGFTRSLRHIDLKSENAIVCVGCDAPLMGNGVSWLIRTCGHLYCRSCSEKPTSECHAKHCKSESLKNNNHHNDNNGKEQDLKLGTNSKLFREVYL